MSLDVASICAKVLARLESDTGTGGLFAGGGAALVTAAVWNIAPQAVTVPYLVFDVSLEAAAGESFTSNGFQAVVGIRSVVSRRTVSTTPLERMADINARIYGDSGSNAGVPSYGLHRWLITGVSGWNFTPMRFLAQVSDVDGDDEISVITNFQIDAITQTW